jgi:hypothetical protein
VLKKISHVDEEGTAPDAAAPLLFDPSRNYTNDEIAEKCRKNPRTIKRWRKQKKIPAAVELSYKTKLTPGHVLNRWWAGLVKNSV